ncbi:MAG: hypothetical protein R3351_00125 [Nitrospirales bacterium]|nr:hypothetical protein [Nitrospirales bacterium]
MLVMLILIAAVLLLIWIGSILQRVFADFLSYFLLAYLSKFGYSQFKWIEELSEIISTLAVVWLAYVLWKDFGKNRLQTLLKAFQH